LHIVGVTPEPEDLHVEPDLNVQRVFPRFEKIGKAVQPELVAFLFLEHFIDPGLNIGHTRVEDEHVRTKIRGRAGLNP
jgi:hypothetical protein